MESKTDAELIEEAESVALVRFVWSDDERRARVLARELARRLKEKLDEEANWRTEVNRLNQLLANTAEELAKEREKQTLFKLDKDSFKRQYLGEWSPSPAFCTCVGPTVANTASVCGRCGKRRFAAPTITSTSNPDDGGK